MKILTPVDRLDEVAPLIEAGADELYGGFVPPGWRDDFRLVGSLNKRTFAEAQFTSVDELARAVKLTRSRGKRFYLTLNNDFYSAAQTPAVLAEVERAIDLGVDALIVADLGLVLEIKQRGHKIPLHLSILAACLNRHAALFWHELGISRIVLDRTLTAAEIAGIVTSLPDVDFETFLMYGKCPNVEGLCSFFHHNDPNHIWPCGQTCELTPVPADSREAEAAVKAQATWADTVRGNACGLCAYYDLEKAGLAAVKIAGRGRKTDHKLAAVRAIAKMREMSLSGAGRADIREAGARMHQELFNLPCDPYGCYYPAEE